MIILFKGSFCPPCEEQTVRDNDENRELTRHRRNSGGTPDTWAMVVTLGPEGVRTGEVLDIF